MHENTFYFPVVENECVVLVFVLYSTLFEFFKIKKYGSRGENFVSIKILYWINFYSTLDFLNPELSTMRT